MLNKAINEAHATNTVSDNELKYLIVEFIPNLYRILKEIMKPEDYKYVEQEALRLRKSKQEENALKIIEETQSEASPIMRSGSQAQVSKQGSFAQAYSQ